MPTAAGRLPGGPTSGPWHTPRRRVHDVEVEDHRTDRRAPSARHVATALLVVLAAALAAGGVLRLGGWRGSDMVWEAAGAVGAAYALWTVIDSLVHRRLGVDVIALLAVIGTLAVHEYLASAVVSVMLATGRALEDWSARRARRDLRSLLERAPRLAHRYRGGGVEDVAVDDVLPGDLLMVATGEVVPVDGRLTSVANLDESMLTGESLPIERDVADSVRSGAVNAGRPFDLRVTATAAESTYAGVVRLVAAAEASQPPFVRLADRYALGFLAVTAVVGSLAWIAGSAGRAVAVLVVATPCPLILAAPVAFVAGLSLSARRGVVVKGGGVLERLARCTTLLFDKTGTLTAGRPRLVSVVTVEGAPADEVIATAASLDQFSPHVLAGSLVRAAEEHGQTLVLPEGVEEVPGSGIRGTVGGHPVAVGSARWTGVSAVPPWAKSALRRARLDGALTVFVAIDGEPAGVLVFEDPIRSDAAQTLRALRRAGVDRLVMVTGDRSEVAEAVGASLALDGVVPERSPAEKLDVVIAEQRRAPTIMVGDGVNDAPALAAADVGVAMGARGATASTEAADIVLGVDRLDRLAEVRLIASRTRRIAFQSVVAGMAMSLAAMFVAAVGDLPAVWGALLQEGIDVAVILNALRALRPTAPRLVLDQATTELARRFRAEHAQVQAVADRVRAVADAMDRRRPDESLRALHDVHRQLVEVVLPHEVAEDRELYPSLDRAIGGANPTGPMSREHAEIAHQIRRLGQLLDDIGPDGCDEEDVADVRRLLYGLTAVLRLHNAKEEESYLSIEEPEPVGSEPVGSEPVGRRGAGSPAARAG